MLLALIATLRRPSVVALLATAALPACNEGGERPSADELLAFIALHCEQADACNCEGTVVAETCEDDLRDRWNERVRHGEQHELTYDAECFAALTTDVEGYGCYQPGGEAPLCSRFCAVFHGEQPLGEACEGIDALVSDCAQGLVCHEGTCREPCTVLAGRQAGEPCASELVGRYDDCAAGLSCTWQTNTCQPRVGLGQPCGDTDCLEGLFCDWQTNTCVAAATEGQSCDQQECADELYCDWREDRAVCASYAAEGESCTLDRCAEPLWCNEQELCQRAPGEGEPCLFGSECAEGLVCDFELVVCTSLPSVGEPCLFGECGHGSWCLVSADDPEGTCTAPVANGQMCSGHRQCESGFCPNGFCWAQPGLGEDCQSAGVCAPGLVCNGEICEPTQSRAPAVCSYQGF